MKSILSAAALVLLLAGGSAIGQNTAKKDLVAQVLQLQQGALEALSRSLLEQTVVQTMQQVGVVLQQRVPADQRQELAKEIQGDFRRFVDDSLPILRDQIGKVAPQTIGTLLEERMTEEELRQLIAALKSPALRKYQSLQGEMQRAFSEKMVAEARSLVQPKAQAMNLAVQQRLAPYLPAASSPR